MIRQQFVSLDAQPNGELLRAHQAKSGFRLFYEKHTGLYYLDGADRDNSKRPGFDSQGGYAPVLNHKSRDDLHKLKEFVREQVKAKTLGKHQFDADLVQDALFLSGTFQTRVFCAYYDDEDTDIVAIANHGVLERLCFSAAPREHNDRDADPFEVTYRMGSTPRLHPEQNEFEGYNSLYQREFLAAFGKPAPDLSFFGQPKSSQADMKIEAAHLNISQAALLRLYGQFKLVDSEENQTHPALERFYRFFDLALKIILMPFILIAVLVMSVRDDLKHRKSRK
ncbi:MAG: hypothetical protein ACSHX3_10420 [Litorimonas sp.]